MSLVESFIYICIFQEEIKVAATKPASTTAYKTLGIKELISLYNTFYTE